MMRVTRHPHISWKCRLLALCLLLFPFLAHGQNADLATVIRGIDASVQNRVVHVASYVAIEHYSVYRGSNKTAPDAEMTVRTEYRRSQGKNFTILSQNGSSLLRNKLLGTLLDNEKKMSQPGTRENVLINSANYAMTLQAGTPQMLNGHPCLVLNLHPRRNDFRRNTLGGRKGLLDRSALRQSQQKSIDTGRSSECCSSVLSDQWGSYGDPCHSHHTQFSIRRDDGSD